MPDAGHEATEAILKTIENRVNREYAQAEKEVQAKLNNFIETYKQEGKEWTLSVEQIRKMINEEQMILTITTDGYGKRTSAYEYRITGRGGKGISNINLQPDASVVMTLLADNSKDIMMIGTKGKTIRIPAANVSLISRNTKGVKVFNLENGETIASVSTIQQESDK